MKKNVGEAPISGGVHASKTWIFYSACKNSRGTAPPRGRNIVFQNAGYNCTSKSP